MTKQQKQQLDAFAPCKFVKNVNETVTLYVCDVPAFDFDDVNCYLFWLSQDDVLTKENNAPRLNMVGNAGANHRYFR